MNVIGLERNRCDACEAQPIMRDQIKRNELRVREARANLSGVTP
jgi:hypothetical protein